MGEITFFPIYTFSSKRMQNWDFWKSKNLLCTLEPRFFHQKEVGNTLVQKAGFKPPEEADPRNVINFWIIGEKKSMWFIAFGERLSIWWWIKQNPEKLKILNFYRLFGIYFVYGRS